ncbi:MAG: uroporphyrinogen-III C-methyltransferase [Flexistipes sinusarabici]|uniref:uroporphyrinogen-III C-methyltransferase n=1 Tax=Flexistipes sinusarabici TaxID=2352 RepID=A0A5D0MJ11_FLESI|nr:uroporphyrinogen-III C-methyltransferase [Flexistipes sinusarabici]TYB32966.1 MAG: uroporphyrinogen-III C-methyltransferase [Flexistipes sinusarabici]
MGKLTLIGAGNSCDLMTLRGLGRLKKADIILYDRLIDIAILENVSGSKINVGKIPYGNRHNQKYINQLIRKYLLMDFNVVRLKSGDVSIFSRASEEIETGRDCGAVIEIVPGVTTASAFSAKIKAVLTKRDVSSGVVFITGHKSRGNIDDKYNWRALVELGMTIAVYMGVKNMKYIAERLIEHGLPNDTPVVVGEDLENAGERILFDNLLSFYSNFDEYDISFPAVVFIGEALRSTETPLECTTDIGCLSEPFFA